MAWWLCPSHPLTSPPIVQCSSHQVPATGPLTVTTTGGWHAASVPPISLLLRFFLYSLDLFHDFCAEGPRIAFQGDTWPTTFFFFPFLFHCKSPALGGALWGGPPFIFFKIQLILQDEDNITVLFRNECDQIRPKLAVTEGTATNIHLAAKLTTTETWKFHQSIADMMWNRLEQDSIKSEEKRPR